MPTYIVEQWTVPETGLDRPPTLNETPEGRIHYEGTGTLAKTWKLPGMKTYRACVWCEGDEKKPVRTPVLIYTADLDAGKVPECPKHGGTEAK